MMKQQLNSIVNSRTKSFILVFSFYLISHIFFFNLPPQGAHSWRQANTSAVARNFVEEDMNILQPRVDRRKNTNGVTGMQFPSFEFTVAIISKMIGGYHESLNRIVSFLFFGLGLYFFYSLIEYLFKSKPLAFFGMWAMSWSPVLYYHSINALPDILALAASIGGLLYFFKWNSTRSSKYILLALFWTTLAGLTKIQYLAIGFFILTIVVQYFLKKKYKTKDLIYLVAYGAISCITSISWYLYANHLIEKSGLRDFGLVLRPLTNLVEIVKVLSYNIFIDLPEYIVGYASALPLLFGIHFLYKKKIGKHALFLGFVIWALSLTVYYYLEIANMGAHTYYLFPTFIMIFMVVAFGLREIWEKYSLLSIFLMFLMPIAAFARVNHNWLSGKDHFPAEFQSKEERLKFESIIPKGSLTIVGKDQTGCLYHYYTHTKGFTFTTNGGLLENNESTSKTDIEVYIEQGAQYLITDKEEIENYPELKKYLGEELSFNESLRIFRLKK